MRRKQRSSARKNRVTLERSVVEVTGRGVPCKPLYKAECGFPAA